MRRAQIDEQNRRQLKRQRDYRAAADVIVAAWMKFPEIEAIAVMGSVARPLWKEVPRFRESRRAGIEVWHECADLDLAVWISSQHRLGDVRGACARALRRAFEAGTGISVAPNEVDTFLFEPNTDRYLGRLCRFSSCPKGKLDCLTSGCGEIPFNKKVLDFEPHADIVSAERAAMLYRRGAGWLRSAVDLPTVGEGAG
jgi:hypothetical protein